MHCYDTLFELIYDNKLLTFPHLPQILGLTASPIIHEITRSHNLIKVDQYRKQLIDLCSNLDSNFVNYDFHNV